MEIVNLGSIGFKAPSYRRFDRWVSSMDPSSATNRRPSMSDDTSKSQGQDRQRINVNQDYELRDWAKSLKTTPERVKEAVQAVGDRVDKVREYLGERGQG
jgi:hypothetical protein